MEILTLFATEGYILILTSVLLFELNFAKMMSKKIQAALIKENNS